MIAGLVLAAGDARRFGEPKQLARLRGRPLLEHALAAMAGATLDRVVVVLGAHAAMIQRGVDLHCAEPVLCPEWEHGQSASLRAGVAALREADAVVVALGDQPFLSPRAVDAVIGARGPGARAVRAVYDGVPGHPVVLERSMFDEILAVRGDQGARGLLAGSGVREVACDGLGRPDDIDTREQLETAESLGAVLRHPRSREVA